jgi:hypothetical protein
VERWIDPAVDRIYAVLDNLNIHSAPDVLLFGLVPVYGRETPICAYAAMGIWPI